MWPCQQTPKLHTPGRTTVHIVSATPLSMRTVRARRHRQQAHRTARTRAHGTSTHDASTPNQHAQTTPRTPTNDPVMQRPARHGIGNADGSRTTESTHTCTHGTPACHGLAKVMVPFHFARKPRRESTGCSAPSTCLPAGHGTHAHLLWRRAQPQVSAMSQYVHLRLRTAPRATRRGGRGGRSAPGGRSQGRGQRCFDFRRGGGAAVGQRLPRAAASSFLALLRAGGRSGFPRPQDLRKQCTLTPA